MYSFAIMFPSFERPSDSEELVKVLEIQQGIFALSEKIIHGKQLEDVIKLRTIIQKLDSRILRVFLYEIKKPLVAVLSHPENWWVTELSK